MDTILLTGAWLVLMGVIIGPIWLSSRYGKRER